MSIEWFFGTGLVIVRDWFIENAKVTCFFDVGRHCQHQPQRIIVEAGTDIVISAFGQRLILMIRAACFKLRGSNIQNAFTRPLRDEMHKAKQILIRVAESHAAPDTALEV